jgi:hypothetical protein
MNRAIIMNRAAVACGAEFLLFFWLVANGLVRRQDFILVLIALFHSIHLPLMFRAIRVSRLVAETLGAVLGGEI